MGFGDWIKKKLNIGSAPEEQAAEPEQAQEEALAPQKDEEVMEDQPQPAVDDAIHQQEEVAEESIQLPANGLTQLGQKLGTLKKGRFRSTNSAQYEAVRTAISDVTAFMGTGFTGDRAANQRMAMDMLIRYGALQSACETYLAKASDRFSSGRARKETVESILALAQKDISGIRMAIDQIPSMSEAELSKYSWQDVLADARTRKITLSKDIHSVETLGGAASTVKHLTGADVTGEGGTGFFKEHESMKRYAAEDSVDTPIFNKICADMKPVAMKLSPLSPAAQQQIADVKSPGTINHDPKYFTKELLDFAAVWEKITSGHKEVYNHMFGDWAVDTGTAVGADVSVSKRNVASSRMAELLGQGNVIAHSELAQVTDKSGRVLEGILMQQAEGKSGADLAEAFQTQKQKECFESGKEYEKAMGNFTYDMTTPSLQKSMSTLQIMDWISGQVDRHKGNYFIQRDAQGKMTGVTGIDNDFAFGRTAGGGNYGAYTVQDGRLNIPHMDKDLAMRIMALTPDTIQLFLGDILDPQLTDACWGRVKQLQDAIQAELADTDSKVFIDKDEDWNEDTHRDFMATAGATRLDDLKRSNYYANFMADPLNGVWNFAQQQWIDDYTKKEYEEYIRIRCIDSPGLFREYLVREMDMDAKTAARHYARGNLDPLRVEYKDLPSDVKSCMTKFFGSSQAYSDKKAKIKSQAAAGEQ